MCETEKKTIRLCIIGAGAIGQKHALLLRNIDGAELVGISDVNPAAEKFATEIACPYYADYEEMLKELSPEGVIVATPTATHSQTGIACARSGAHILMEKPIAENLEEARKLVDGAEECEVHLLVGHHRRHNPLVESIKETINNGHLGKLVGVNVLWMLKKPDDYYDALWRCKPGGGPFLTNLIHDIDNLRYICGEVQRVYAETSSSVRKLEVEDSGSVVMRFKNGVVASLLVSDCTPSSWSYEQSSGENPFYYRTDGNCYHFFGTEGSLSFPDMNIVHFADKQKTGWQHPLVNSPLDVVSQDPLVVQLKHFCKVIRGKERPKITGEDGLRTLAVVRGILDSAQQGVPVEFDW